MMDVLASARAMRYAASFGPMAGASLVAACKRFSCRWCFFLSGGRRPSRKAGPRDSYSLRAAWWPAGNATSGALFIALFAGQRSSWLPFALAAGFAPPRCRHHLLLSAHALPPALPCPALPCPSLPLPCPLPSALCPLPSAPAPAPAPALPCPPLPLKFCFTASCSFGGGGLACAVVRFGCAHFGKVTCTWATRLTQLMLGVVACR